MSTDWKKAKAAVRELYPELINLQLDVRLLGALVKAEVITNHQMTELQEQKAGKRVADFWDNIIIRSLGAGSIKQFVGLLKVMDASENRTTKDLARKLSDEAGIPIPGIKPSHGNEQLLDRGKGGGAFHMFQLLECMECVCRIESPKRRDGATGFVGNILLGRKNEHFIITCHHVIPDDETARKSKFIFNHINSQYEPDKMCGDDLFDKDSDDWFWTNQDLNYTAIKVKLGNVRYARKCDGEQIKMEISGIPLFSANVDLPFDVGHILTIIQQVPTMKLCEGSCKQKKDEKSAMLKYRMNTANGSGGAPIFKENGGELCLIGMHIGNWGSSNDYNCGVRISEVLKHLKGEKDKCSSMPVDVTTLKLE